MTDEYNTIRLDDGHGNVSNIAGLQKSFAFLIKDRTRAKWRACKLKHKYQLDILNARFTESELKRAIHSFDNNKSAGPDRIDIKFIKKCPISSNIILNYLYELIFKWELIPIQMKQRWIVPIIKSGKIGNKAKELRPVSLTSYIGKILEKMMVYRIISYLVRLELLSNAHFAYLPNRGPHECLTYMIDHIQQNIIRHQNTHCVYFDLSSAFDTVHHNVLIWKLKHEYFMDGKFINILTAFLENREGAVKIGGMISDWMKDKIGVPQGGALSPILYLIYVDGLGIINDIYGIKLCIFSDDLSLFTSDGRITSKNDARQRMQYCIYMIQWYAKYHGLQMNMDKTIYKIFKRGFVENKDKLLLFISGKIDAIIGNRENGNFIARKLAYIDEPVKYLGIWLDTALTFTEHAKRTNNKILRVYHIIRRNMSKYGILKLR